MARTKAKDHDQKRDHILRVAATVFAESGCTRTSMEMIARRCGISKANIYHYYSSKDALIFGILDTYLSSLRERLYGLPLEGLEPSQRLQAVVVETLLAYEGMDHEHKIQIEGVPLLPAEQQEILKGYQRDMIALLSSILLDIAPNVFGTDSRKLREATMSVFGMLNWFYLWNRKAGRKDRKRYAELVTRLNLGGLGNL